MAISLESLQHGVSMMPPAICMHGDEGIGKSSMATNAPNPVFIFTENSLGNLDVPRWHAKSYEDVMEMTLTLIEQPHDFKTAVYDTIDWFEPMLWDYLLRTQPTDEKGREVKNIEDYGFGKGYKFALDYWRDFLGLVDRLRTERGMAVIFLAHSTLQKISPPDGDSYDSWILKLQNSDKVSAKDKITEYCDAVLFTNWRVALTEEKLGFGNTRQRGIGSGERIVYTEKRPAWDAKNRYSLPAQIHIKDKNWGELWQKLSENIPWFSTLDEPKKTKEPAKAAEGRPKFIKQKKED